MTDIEEIGRLARQEFAALALVKLKKEDCKRDAVRKFRADIKSHFALLEFEKNGKHFRNIRPEVSTLDENEEPTTPVRKQTKELSKKAEDRVRSLANTYTKLFKQELEGATVDYNHEVVSQRAKLCLDKYKALVALTEPSRDELIRSFLTWIDGIVNDKEQAISVFRGYNISSIKKSDIFYTWTPLQPTQLKYRTFDI